MTKRYTYPLLLLVLLIWGAIFYRVFSPKEKKVLLSDVAILRHTLDTGLVDIDYNLIMNYRDPFLDEVLLDKHDSNHEAIEESFLYEEAVDSVNDWSIFNYKGLIRNIKDKRPITLMSIDGVDVMLKDGDSYEGMKLVKNEGIFITIYYNGEYHEVFK